MSISPMNTSEIIQALTPLVEAFDHFDIAYYILLSLTITSKTSKT